jgi:hypothetical protein
MAEQNEPNKSDKAEDTVKRCRKPPEYRRFERLLKQVIKSPPMRKESPPSKLP